jgi:tetratricopeptide (TPR) repeat protein
LSEEKTPYVVYEEEKVPVEEYVERSVTVVATPEQAQAVQQATTTPTAMQATKEEQAREGGGKAQEVSDQEAEDLITLIKRLRGAGYIVASSYSDLDLLKSQVKYSRKLYNSVLNECKGAIIGLIALTRNLVEYWLKWHEARSPTGYVISVIGKTYDEAVEALNNLLSQAQTTASARDLIDILERALGIYERFKTAKIELGWLITSAKSSVDAMLSKTTDQDARRALEAYKRAIELLEDKARLKDLLARFFVLMDLVREETYRLYMDTYFDYSRSLVALINIVLDKASYDDFIAGLNAALILLELESKGALDVEKFFPVKQERTYKYHYESKLKAIERGALPSREPVGIVQLAETLVKIDPSRYVYNLVYNVLKGVFGEQVAKGLASAASGATTGAILKAVPAFGVILVLEGISDLGSRLANPIDREILAKFLKDNWQEVAIYTAIAVGAAIGAGFAINKLKTPVLTKIADAIERVSPTFAEKIRSHIAPKVIIGKPIYQERDVVVTITDDGKLLLFDRSKGTVEVVQSFKLSDKALALLQDPDVGVKVGSWVAKYGKGIKSIGLVGDDLVFVGDAQLAIFSPSKGLIVIDRTSPLLEVARTSPEAFKLYYVASKLGLSSDDLLDPALNQYFTLFKQQGYAYGQVNIKGLLFDFRGDKLYVVSGVKEIATIDLARFDGAMFLNLLTAGKSFLNAHGQLYYHIALDTIAFGYGLLSPQTVSLDVLSRLSTTPIININDLLPRVQQAIGATGFSAKGQVYVSSQMLATGVRVETLFAREVVKNVLGKLGFKEYQLSIIELSPEALLYVKQAQAGGALGLDAISKAAEIAKSAGDLTSAQLLAQLALNLHLSALGLTTLQVAASTSTGSFFVFTAVSAALAGVSQQFAEQVVRGDLSGAKQTLVNALVATGLSQQVAQQLAEELARSLAGVSTAQQAVTVPVVVPVRSTGEVVVSTAEYETVTELVETSSRDIVVDVPVVIPVSTSGEVVVPTVEYETAVEEVDATSTDRAVVLPVEIPVVSEGVVDVPYYIVYEVVEEYGREHARGVVKPVQVVVKAVETVGLVKPIYDVVEESTRERARGVVIPVVVAPEERVLVASSSEYDVVEERVRERAAGTVVPVVVEETVTALVTIPVDIEEEYEPPPQQAPQATGGFAGIPPLGAGAREATEKRKQEGRKGIGELELLVY